ncbi:MAG: F0F1 ATP synthase subunit B [Campylobacteraceae bacterium]|jgi:F-type H+-transporting ATPase subunit b|nr:F0F1 ATP synthase subunit B [Campylobacteraceae bacterium]
MLRYVVLLMIPILSFASGTENTDIFQRLINFFLFAGLFYYLLVSKFKIQNIFKNRKSSIADRLNAIQEKLKESKNQKNIALEKLEEAKVNAKAFLATSQKESEMLLEKIKSDLQIELENLEKSHKDQIDIERRKMVRQVVSEVLEGLFSADSIKIDRNKFVDIILKKVA